MNRHVYEIRMCMRMYETGMCMIQAWAPFGSRGAALREHGIKSYVCPGTSSWLSFGGRVPNALANIVNAATAGARFGAQVHALTRLECLLCHAS